jgi:hypothetical protein
MELTTEQREQLQQAKERGERREFVEFTPEQRKSWREAAEQELAGKDENLAHRRKIMAAADQPGFFGDIRRAIILSRRSRSELANSIGIDQRLLSDFRTGEAVLPEDTLGRLIDALGLRLMQEIPR